MAGLQLLPLLLAVFFCGTNAAARVIFHAGSRRGVPTHRQPTVDFAAFASFTSPTPLGSISYLRENFHFAFWSRIRETPAGNADPHAFTSHGQKPLCRTTQPTVADCWIFSLSAPSSVSPLFSLPFAFLHCFPHAKPRNLSQKGQKSGFSVSQESVSTTTPFPQSAVLAPSPPPVSLSFFSLRDLCRLKFESRLRVHPESLISSRLSSFSSFSGSFVPSHFWCQDLIPKALCTRLDCPPRVSFARRPMHHAKIAREVRHFAQRLLLQDGRGASAAKKAFISRPSTGFCGTFQSPQIAQTDEVSPSRLGCRENDRSTALFGCGEELQDAHGDSGGAREPSAESDSVSVSSRVDHHHGYGDAFGTAASGERTDSSDDETASSELASHGDDVGCDAAFLLKKAEELPRDEIEGLIQHLRENLPHLFAPVHAQFVDEIHRRLTADEKTRGLGSEAPSAAASDSETDAGEAWREAEVSQFASEDEVANDAAASIGRQSGKYQEDAAGASDVASDAEAQEERSPEAQVSDSLFDDLSIYSGEELQLILRLLLCEAEKVDRTEATGTSTLSAPESALAPTPRRDLSVLPWETEGTEDTNSYSSVSSIPLAELLASRESIDNLTDIPRYKIVEFLEKLSPFVAALPFDDFLNAPSAFTTEQLRDLVGLALARMQQGVYTAQDPLVVRRLGKWRARREKYAASKKKELLREEQETLGGDAQRCGADRAGVLTEDRQTLEQSKGDSLKARQGGASEKTSVKYSSGRHHSEKGGEETRNAFRGLDLSLPSGTLDPSKLHDLSLSMSRGVYGVKTLPRASGNPDGSSLGGEDMHTIDGEEIDVADLEDEAQIDGTSQEDSSPRSGSAAILGVADQAEVEGMNAEELTLAGTDACEMGVTTLRTILASDENAPYRPRRLRTKADVEALSWRELRDAYTELSRRAQGDEKTDIVQGRKKIVKEVDGDEGSTPGGLRSRSDHTRANEKKNARQRGRQHAEETERGPPEDSPTPANPLAASTWSFDPISEKDWTPESLEEERLRKGRDAAAAAGGCLQYVVAHLKRAEALAKRVPPASWNDESRSPDHLKSVFVAENEDEVRPQAQADSQVKTNVGGEDEDRTPDLHSPSSTPASSGFLETSTSPADTDALPLALSPPSLNTEFNVFQDNVSAPLAANSLAAPPVSKHLPPPSPALSSLPPSFLAFRRLGLSPSVAAAASAFLGASASPSPVQEAAIPRTLRFMNAEDSPRGALVLGAQTGSGKTLAYLLPLVHHLKREEEREKESRAWASRRSRGPCMSETLLASQTAAVESSSACATFIPSRGEEFDEEALSDEALRAFDQKEAGRPRALILTPTWELADQVARTLKALSASSLFGAGPDESWLAVSRDLHKTMPGQETHATRVEPQHFDAPRLSVLTLAGDSSLGLHRQQLRERTRLDVVVGTPPRILKLVEWGLLKLGDLRFVVIDEADAMLLSEGFDAEIREILEKVSPKQRLSDSPDSRRSPEMHGQGRNDGGNSALSRPYRRGKDTNGFGSENAFSRFNGALEIPVIAAAATVSSRLERALESLTGGPVGLVQASGIHVPPESVRHEMIDLGGRDKLDVLREVLRSHEGVRAARKVLVFTNSIQACRACEFAAKDTLARTSGGSGKVLSCHGSMPPATRKIHFSRFANGVCKFLVCTDLASRGLDLPAVDAVILFDFPLSPVAYIHRAGRTGRMGRKGLVVSFVTKKDQVLATAIQRALEKGTASLAELSSDKADYQKGGRLHFLSQAGGYNVKERKLSEPYRAASKTRRAGWKPPKSAAWHQERAERIRRRRQKQKAEKDYRQGQEKKKKEEQRQRSKRGAVIAAAKRKP
uniref:DEAD/DEAH box helicase domain-containing protein n=1 Tax=Toxoplasma gondii COUG TaxID=1074873 RepID=A0A2G8YDE5_TOXGO|nr:DEAD/DEAH box helicase domain-containing protein [Toxoplasma gondii COUG]